MRTNLKETILKIINSEITIEEVDKDDLIQVIIESELSIELLTKIERMDETLLVSALSDKNCSVKTMKKIHSVDPRILLYFAFIQDYPLELLKRIYLIDKYILLEIALSKDCSIITLKRINEIDENISYLAIHLEECSKETICKINMLSVYHVSYIEKLDDKDTLNPFADPNYDPSNKDALTYQNLLDREKENWKCMREEYKHYKKQKDTYLSKYHTVAMYGSLTYEDFEDDFEYNYYLRDNEREWLESVREQNKYHIPERSTYSNDSIQDKDLINKRKKEIMSDNTSSSYTKTMGLLEKYTLFKKNECFFGDIDRLIFSKQQEECEEDFIDIDSVLIESYTSILLNDINQNISKFINLLSDVERLNLSLKKGKTL